MVPVRSTKAVFKEDDLLYGKLRPYLNKVYLAELDGICSTDILVFPKAENLSYRYLSYRFLSEDFVRYANANSTGVQHPRIKFESIAKFPIPLPPSTSSAASSAKLKNSPPNTKRAREALADVPSLIDQFRQSVLAAAFRGDLTAEWREQNPDVESASELLERIRTQTNYVSGQETPCKASGKRLPAKWVWVRVDNVGKVSLGRQRSPKNHHGPNMRPYIRAANITWQGWNLSDVKEMNFDERDFQTFKLKPGDVLINEGSGSADEVGKPAIWDGEIPDCCFQNTLVSVRPFEKMSKYLYFVFLHAALSKAFVEETRGVNIHHIGKQGLAQFLIPLPPIAEQIEIVDFLEEHFKALKLVEEQYKSSQELSEALNQSILAKAFRGELVPQDPNDEPAAVFLERIRAEREQLGKTKSKRCSSRK
ncbi:restriction endonuclease subunit S [Romeria aff. gracilis LEGE 07310]|uniref:Restriction endonuclease subunit S n=1 Tax=Vasconcelosia minhoensis LEGE 07310 TaxID=915328 RepID=A0A8J7DDT3_9CYAN|nr:restriction endonuclease subunit S [Romeria gracilis]MBE9080212.1 restriction endonuclease subunit S [Romeria aff. gracilis LEGE 07310]